MLTIEQIAKDVAVARRRLQGVALRTPLRKSRYLSEINRSEAFLKLEFMQTTGSCKFRSVANKLHARLSDVRQRGVVTASTGNNAIAHAYLLGQHRVRGTVFVPGGSDREKLAGLSPYGLSVRFKGNDIVEAEAAARAYASTVGAIYCSPYNDELVIAGQGTLGLEILEDLPDVNSVLLAVGGGGLISGVGALLKTRRPGVRVIGCAPIVSATMKESIDAGKIVDYSSVPSISDSAGGVERGSITFALCQKLVDEFILVEEVEIYRAMKLAREVEGIRLEGAGALAIAAFLKQADRFEGKRVVLCLCGMNIGQTRYRQAIGGSRG